jgi:ankyrin repeat protein
MKKEWFEAIEQNDINKVNELINQGIDVNIQNNNGDNALIYASFNGYKEIVELLLKHPNININTPEGIHPVNVQNKFGDTALIAASSRLNKEIVELLLKQPNINVEIEDNNGFNFISILKDKSYLIDYQLQKQILNNQREDIILFLNKYNLVYPDIKSELPELFQASDWGLI